MLGFSYNGKHTDEMHIGYIPDAGDRGDLVSDYAVVSADRSWAPGADYYTTRTKVREFKLKCFYEMITRREREEILRWIDRRTSGYLIFDDRPYARYTVRPNKAPDIKDYTQFVGTERVFSGTMTIYFAAYYPFAELTEKNTDEAGPEALADLDLLPSSMMPSSGTLIYNPGTELGQSIITTTGAATITNNTNGDMCAITSGNCVIDSKRGSVVRSGSLDFSVHNYGYIHFVPNRIIRNNIQVKQTSGSTTIQGYGSFASDMVGAYIYLGSTWKKIISFTDSSHIVVASSAGSTATTRTIIATMNELSVTGSATIQCRPEVR